MERYGCLIIGIIIALIILTVTVYYWSGWLNRPVGHSPPPPQTLTLPLAPGSGSALPAWPDSGSIPLITVIPAPQPSFRRKPESGRISWTPAYAGISIPSILYIYANPQPVIPAPAGISHRIYPAANRSNHRPSLRFMPLVNPLCSYASNARKMDGAGAHRLPTNPRLT